MKDLLQSIKNLRVGVLGDIMLDHYIWGGCDRISPEAPVPVVHVKKDTYVPGGAANVALGAARLGAKSHLMGQCGHDDAGGHLSALLQSEGIHFDPRFAQAEAPTIIKTRVIAGSQQLCRIDRESSPEEYKIEGDEELWNVIEERLKHVDALIVSDYAKGTLTQGLIDRVVAFAKPKGIFLAADPKPRHFINYTGFDLLTPNKAEAIMMAKLDTSYGATSYTVSAALDKLFEQYKIPNIVITLGSDGMALRRPEGTVKIIPTAAREVFDVSGAGDTVITALTLAMAVGASLERASEFANVAAGIVISKLGTACASPEEILSYQSEVNSVA